MIKRITDDAERVVSYLTREGSINTTLLALIEKYGFNKDFQEIWFQVEEDKINALIMRHFNYVYLYSWDCNCDFEELGGFVSFTGADVVLGKKGLLENILPYVDGFALEPSCHMVLENPEKLLPPYGAEKAKLDDCREMASLIYSVPEFARFYHSCEEIERGIRRRMEMGEIRCFVIKRDGLIVSQAYTTMESTFYASIGGVVTRDEYRNQGFASQVVSSIAHDILKDKKFPNLFFSNNKAGEIYKKLGFAEICEYGMLLPSKYCLNNVKNAKI